MNALVPLMPMVPVAASRVSDDRRGPRCGEPANDDHLVSSAFDEQPLRVSFVGISASDAARAIGSFPGGRRCVIAEP